MKDSQVTDTIPIYQEMYDWAADLFFVEVLLEKVFDKL